MKLEKGESVVRKELNDRCLFLEGIIKKYGAEYHGYNKTLEGKHLQLHHHGNCVTYYERMEGQKNGKYLSKKTSMSRIRNLAQKDYDQKILTQAQRELEEIEGLLEKYPKCTVEQVQEEYERGFLDLITPLVTSDEQYVKAWQETLCPQNDYYTENCIYGTKRGEMVRSKSEVLIADALLYEKIPYHYERAIYIEGIGTCHPDFTVLNVRTRQEYIWEHFGMMAEMDYAQGAVKKIQQYQKAGYVLGKNFIATFEDAMHPLTPGQIGIILEEYLL